MTYSPITADEAFRERTYALRLSHYPAQEVVQDNEVGLAPHTDTSFMTLLPENKVPGLSVRMANGKWVDAPVLDDSFLVNKTWYRNRNYDAPPTAA